MHQLFLNGSQAFDSARIDRVRRTIVDKRADDDFQVAQPMIENQKHARNHEQRLGQLKFIALCGWNFGLEKVDRLVADESHSAAGEARQLLVRYKPITPHQFSNLVEGITAHFESPFVSILDDSNLAPVALQNHM